MWDFPRVRVRHLGSETEHGAKSGQGGVSRGEVCGRCCLLEICSPGRNLLHSTEATQNIHDLALSFCWAAPGLRTGNGGYLAPQN